MPEANSGQQVVYILQHADPFRIEINRGMHGKYGWSIQVFGDKIAEIILDLEALDNKLRERFGNSEE